jgi:hypothetical protein
VAEDGHKGSTSARVAKGPVFIRRDEQNRIISVSRVPAPDHVESSSADRTEVIAFIGGLSPRKAALLESDLSLIRALEDLIDVLIRKDVLRLTDLPDSVQAKLLARRNLRGSLTSLNLLDEDNGLL